MPTDRDRLLELKAELDRRRRIQNIATELCFDRQLEFIDDPRKRKILICTRRAGKSYTLAVYIVQEALRYAGRSFRYYGLTGEAAKDAVFPIIVDALKHAGITKFEYNNTTKNFTLPNKSTIRLMGLDSAEQNMKRLKGSGPHLVAVDEVQDLQQDLKKLIDEVLDPMLVDWKLRGGGILCLAGTPGTNLTGYWHDLTRQVAGSITPHPERLRGWSVHTFTMQDNPRTAAEFEAVRQERLAEYGATFEEDPEWQRQWLGRWVLDVQTHVYKFNAETNVLHPKNDEALIRSINDVTADWIFVCGVDFGYEDPSALVVGAYRMTEPTFYVVQSVKLKHASVSMLAEAISTLQTRWRFRQIVVDGSGKQIAKTLEIDYRLPVQSAERHEKGAHQAAMNADFLRGRIKVLPGNQALVDEWCKLVIDRRQFEKGKFVEAANRDNHAADACLYAWRSSFHAHARPVQPPVVPTIAELLLARRRRRQDPYAEDRANPYEREAWAHEAVDRYRNRT